MGKSKKGGLRLRRQHALDMLISKYEAFKKAGVDKASWVSTRKGRLHTHPGRTFAQECERFENEIRILKDKLTFS